MIRNLKFWIPMTVFQIAFGLTIFTLTRQYYLQGSENLSNDTTAMRQPAFVWPDGKTATNLAPLDSSTLSQPAIENPAEIARQADEFFIKKQYAEAAKLYEQLLVLSPNNADTYNNVGITLYYIGRSDEALRRLNEGVAIDPTNQRIWLTLGYVNRQLGDTEQARIALNTAAQMNAENEIGKSALEMLANLP